MAATQGPRILLATDDCQVEAACASACERAGCTLERSPDCQSALALARAGSVDVLVLGCDLSSSAALEILNLSKQLVLPTSVIALVQGGDLPSALGALHGGAVEVMQKPLSVEATEACLLRALNQARMRGGNRSAQQALQSATLTHEFRTDQIARIRFGLELADRLVLGGWMDANVRTRFELAFQEALANAIDHGNLELDSRWREEIDSHGVDRYSKIKQERLLQEKFGGRLVSIQLSFDAAAATFEVRVRDQGLGFEVKASAQANAAGVALHGRGLKLMRECVDSVQYEDDGRCISLLKRLKRLQKPT